MAGALASGELSAAERELIALAVAEANQCSFAWVAPPCAGPRRRAREAGPAAAR